VTPYFRKRKNTTEKKTTESASGASPRACMLFKSTGQEHDMKRHYLTKQQKKAQYMSFEKRRTEAGDSSRAYAQVEEMKLSFTKGQNTINHHTSIHDMSL